MSGNARCCAVAVIDANDAAQSAPRKFRRFGFPIVARLRSMSRVAPLGYGAARTYAITTLHGYRTVRSVWHLHTRLRP
jgi:hypothetical protein